MRMKIAVVSMTVLRKLACAAAIVRVTAIPVLVAMHATAAKAASVKVHVTAKKKRRQMIAIADTTTRKLWDSSAGS